MWRWDQGRLNYFQFDELRKIAKVAVNTDLRSADHHELELATGLPFHPRRPNYKPWRNYRRVFQTAMIAVPSRSGGSKVTEIGKRLAVDGHVTTDEYLHFLAQATTDPSPAFAGNAWNSSGRRRYPLLFVLRFLLARASQGEFVTKIGEVVKAYDTSGFRGDEDQTSFLKIIDKKLGPKTGRQPSESIKVLAQISYLTAIKNEITVSLARDDATALFEDLAPVGGRPLRNPSDEILRVASLFPSAVAALNFDYPATVLTDAEEAGFSEGGRVKRTHLTLERNGRIRNAFFAEYPSPICDFCAMDTKAKYPWTSRILDVHHLLPLCSGARTDQQGTVLSDLVANCPTCHRAVHRYYDMWLNKHCRADFSDGKEARMVYTQAREGYREAGRSHA